MWTQASALLMLACCLWPAEGQSNGNRRQNIWDEPIRFNTKAHDLCTMIITGQGDYTRLRLSCLGDKGAYWCDFLGKPNTCRPYSNNPRHYFVQMMWDLRKLHNACNGPREIKPHMCRKATDESQMVFASSSFSRSRPEASARTRAGAASEARLAAQSARPPPPTTTEPVLTNEVSTQATEVTLMMQTTTPQLDTSPVESNAQRMARQYCWRSLRGVCTYIIGIFRN